MEVSNPPVSATNGSPNGSKESSLRPLSPSIDDQKSNHSNNSTKETNGINGISNGTNGTNRNDSTELDSDNSISVNQQQSPPSQSQNGDESKDQNNIMTKDPIDNKENLHESKDENFHEKSSFRYDTQKNPSKHFCVIRMIEYFQFFFSVWLLPKMKIS